VVRGLGIIKKAEFIIAILIIGLIFTLAIITTPHLSYTHLTGFDWFSFLIPYGAILFACSGLAAIPEAKEILETKKGTKFLRSVIILGHLVPTVIYIIFTLVVVGVTGPETTEIATIGLSSKIGLIALAIGSLFSIIAMSSSFMTLGTAIKGIFQYDYRLKPTNALVATLSIPLILFLIGFREFFGVVSVVGALGVGLSGQRLVGSLQFHSPGAVGHCVVSKCMEDEVKIGRSERDPGLVFAVGVLLVSVITAASDHPDSS
jgi:MFS family permease